MTAAIQRRSFLLLTAAACLPASAWALSGADARRLVDLLVADINAVIASGKSEAEMIKDFEGIFDRYADVPIMARYALGADARSASAAQMKAFTAAFRTYISAKYGRRFREFIGGRIDVEGESAIPRGVQVETMAKMSGQETFRVDFHVSDASGKALFFNIIIEGIDMLLSERTEIGAMLDQRRGDLDRLIADLRAL